MVMPMTSTSSEEWRDIPGYEGKYQVSDHGRVRSLDRRVRCGHGGTRLKKGRVLRPASSKYNPHLYVTLGNGTAGSPVHQLVALAFLGPRPEGLDVRHLDGNAQNNRADNLAYGSRTENILDVFRVGGAWRKLTIADVKDIRDRLQKGESGRGVAKVYGVSEGHISAIKLRRVFAWLD